MMNKVKIFVIAVFGLAGLTGCGEKNNDPVITSLELKLTKSRILGDNIDYASVSVLNQSGNNVRQFVNIYASGDLLNGDKITSQTPSTITVYAKYNDIKSNEVEIEVVEDKNLKFEKNVLVEQYTGTWCGWCPRAITQINTLQGSDKKIVHAAHHLSDEMTYSLNSSLFQSFGFTGVPTVHADRSSVWSGEASAISYMHAPSRVGISLEVTGNSTKVTAAVMVKFGLDYTDDLALTVYLLHDSLTAGQKNFYDDDPSSPWYKMGSPIAGFVHRNVMTRTGTDMYGDPIPSSSVDIGSVYSKNIDLTSFRCEDIRRIVIIAFVTYKSGKNSGKVINSAMAMVGEKKDFVYQTK